VKRCLACSGRYESTGWTCPSCHSTPPDRDGIPAFGIAAGAGTGTDAGYLDTEIRLAEARHFWFRGRVRLVQSMLRRHFPGARRLLDVGCGTGFILESLARVAPSLALAGCDLRLHMLAGIRSRLPEVVLFAADMAALPYESEFDVVTALDVLEHVDDDRAALRALLDVMTPAGGLILTVPQHPWLWSEVDEFSCHRRRYVRADLEAKVREAGFQILRSTSFCAVTLPLLAASRLRRRRAFDPAEELRIVPGVNGMLGSLLRLEGFLIQSGVSLPFGSSLMVIAQRPLAR
jgi:SAM-dependent methyltransferase